MGESPAASDSGRDGQGPGETQNGGEPAADPGGAPFGRTGRALAELSRALVRFGRALRYDLAVALRLWGQWLRALSR
jgi:hypothetical protein